MNIHRHRPTYQFWSVEEPEHSIRAVGHTALSGIGNVPVIYLLSLESITAKQLIGLSVVIVICVVWRVIIRFH